MQTWHAWISVLVLSMFLAEGFALAVFPTEMRALLTQSDPKLLQAAGLIESIVAVALLLVVIFGR